MCGCVFLRSAYKYSCVTDMSTQNVYLKFCDCQVFVTVAAVYNYLLVLLQLLLFLLLLLMMIFSTIRHSHSATRSDTRVSLSSLLCGSERAAWTTALQAKLPLKCIKLTCKSSLLLFSSFHARRILWCSFKG